MPYEMLLNAYKKLFGVETDEQARAGINDHLLRMERVKATAQRMANEEYSVEGLFGGGYFDFCETQVKIAWTRNLIQRMNGKELNRNTEKVTDEFHEYMRGLNVLIKERGIMETLPGLERVFGEGMEEELEPGETLETGRYKGWQNQWKHEVLDKVPNRKIDVAKEAFYGDNLETGSSTRTKVALGRARAQVNSACEGLTRENAAEKCAQAMLALRAVEEKHASRNIFWKIFVAMSNYRENKAIEEMRAQIERTFTPEQIAAASEQIQGDQAWVVAQKSDSILPSEFSAMKVNPLETDAETRQRVELEAKQSAKEKEELANLAEEIEEKSEKESFLEGAEAAKKWEESTARGNERYREKMNNTFEQDLDIEVGKFQPLSEELDFVEDLVEDKESIFVSEVEDEPHVEKSEPSEAKDVPEPGKTLK